MRILANQSNALIPPLPLPVSNVKVREPHLFQIRLVLHAPPDSAELVSSRMCPHCGAYITPRLAALSGSTHGASQPPVSP